MGARSHRRGIGNVIAPPRFLVFAGVFALAGWLAVPPLGLRHGVMAGFDAAALVFFVSCLPLLRYESQRMRIAACRNDANRAILLLVTAAVSLVILAAIAAELMQRTGRDPGEIALIVGTLTLCWLYSNTVYALHYAHLFYSDKQGGDAGGLEFPETPEPDYSDFLYFAFCLGMTFQTSDVTVTDRGMRRVVTLHCLAAFVFNLGVIAFTINVLGG